VQPTDVKFSQNLTHQKSLNRLILIELSEKYKGGRFFGDIVYIEIELRLDCFTPQFEASG